MKKRAVLPQWCKEAKIAMIKQDMTMENLAEKTGKSVRWVSGIINGRTYSPNIVKEISDVLGIADSGNFL